MSGHLQIATKLAGCKKIFFSDPSFFCREQQHYRESALYSPEVNIYPRKWNCISRDSCAKWNQPVSIPFSLLPSMEYEKRFPPLLVEKGKGKPPAHKSCYFRTQPDFRNEGSQNHRHCISFYPVARNRQAALKLQALSTFEYQPQMSHAVSFDLKVCQGILGKMSTQISFLQSISFVVSTKDLIKCKSCFAICEVFWTAWKSVCLRGHIFEAASGKWRQHKHDHK